MGAGQFSVDPCSGLGSVQSFIGSQGNLACHSTSLGLFLYLRRPALVMATWQNNLEWGEGLEIAQLVENLPFRCKATSLVSAPSHIKHGIPALLFEVPEAKTK